MIQCRYCRFDGSEAQVEDHTNYCIQIGDPDHADATPPEREAPDRYDERGNR